MMLPLANSLTTDPKAPSGRELSATLTEGECIKTLAHSTTFRPLADAVPFCRFATFPLKGNPPSSRRKAFLTTDPKAPSGRELSATLTEGECVTIKL